MFLAMIMLMQANAGALEGAATRIDERPELARMFQEKSAPFVRCGRRALETNIAAGAAGAGFENLSQRQAVEIFQKAIDGAARDCGIDRQAAIIANGIRAVLPDIDTATATTIARANLYQLIGFSIWGDQP